MSQITTEKTKEMSKWKKYNKLWRNQLRKGLVCITNLVKNEKTGITSKKIMATEKNLDKKS